MSLLSCALIGLGKMGARIARALLRTGECRLVVWDMNSARLAPFEVEGEVASGLEQVSKFSEVVLLSLPSAKAVEEVLFTSPGLARAPDRPLRFVDLSTLSPSRSRDFELKAGSLGHQYIAAPLSGGIWGAERADLLAFVGLCEGVDPLCERVLRLFCSHLEFFGDAYRASAAKVIHNMVGEAEVHAFSEALAFGAHAGIGASTLYRALSRGMCSSRVLTEVLAPPLNFETEASRVSLGTSLKDQEALAEFLGEQGLTGSFSPLILARMRELVAMGLADRDVAITLRFYERLHGVSFEEQLSSATGGCGA